jgi:hypothetical protein
VCSSSSVRGPRPLSEADSAKRWLREAEHNTGRVAGFRIAPKEEKLRLRADPGHQKRTFPLAVDALELETEMVSVELLRAVDIGDGEDNGHAVEPHLHSGVLLMRFTVSVAADG